MGYLESARPAQKKTQPTKETTTLKELGNTTETEQSIQSVR